MTHVLSSHPMPLKKTIDEFVAEARMIVQEIDAEQLEGDYPDAIIIDVRESEERARGHIPNSFHVPRGKIERDLERIVFAGRIRESDLERPLVCYCRGGSRSVLAARTLNEMGFVNAIALSGGFEAWSKSGRNVDNDP